MMFTTNSDNTGNSSHEQRRIVFRDYDADDYRGSLVNAHGEWFPDYDWESIFAEKETIQNTASQKPELLDTFDANMIHTGIATREKVHADGLWHQCFHCWLVMKDHQGYQYLLFQRRSATKKDFPHLLDITAAGHLMAGETVADGIREVQEELGYALSLEDLTPLGTRTCTQQLNDFHNCEFAHVFIGEAVFAGWEFFRLQEEELDGLFGISIKDGLKLFNKKELSVQAVEAKGFTGTSMGKYDERIKVGVDDFVPQPVDNYYLKMFIAADLYLQGYPHLAIA